jgi:hypothetical protein
LTDAVGPDDLEAAATRIAAVLGDDGVLVGGLAVAAWGYVRATDDIDFVARLPATAVVERLKAAGISSRIHRGGGTLDDGIEWCVGGRLGQVAFDVLPPLVPLRFDRAVTIALARGSVVRVVDLDGLLRLKLKAGGPQDLLDAAQLLRKHPEMLEPSRAVAESYGQWERLRRWLDDPRLR